MRDAHSEELANKAADSLRRHFELSESNTPKTGIVLGTGWGGALEWREERRVTFEQVAGFGKLRPLEGHARQVVCGTIEGQRVVALQGRVHLNEAPADPSVYEAVRLQVEMLIKLGVTRLILTAAAGSLREVIAVGDIMIVDGFISTHAPAMPLFAGEFVSPDDVLDEQLRAVAKNVIKDVSGKSHAGGYAMVRGPFFEGRKYDKPLFMASGASSIGMSTLPEACIAALYRPAVQVLALNFITNTAIEEHSHEVNQQRAREKSGQMGKVLHGLIRTFGELP